MLMEEPVPFLSEVIFRCPVVTVHFAPKRTPLTKAAVVAASTQEVSKVINCSGPPSTLTPRVVLLRAAKEPPEPVLNPATAARLNVWLPPASGLITRKAVPLTNRRSKGPAFDVTTPEPCPTPLTVRTERVLTFVLIPRTVWA